MDVIKWACLHTFCMWCVLCVCVNADYYYMKWINDNALLFVRIFLHCCARSISFLCFFFFSFIHFALNNEWLENNHDVVTLTRNENTKLFTGFNILYVYVIHHRFTGFPPFFFYSYLILSIANAFEYLYRSLGCTWKTISVHIDQIEAIEETMN